MIYIILKYLRYVLWLRMWFILMNVPYEFEMNVYSAVVG